VTILLADVRITTSTTTPGTAAQRARRPTSAASSVMVGRLGGGLARGHAWPSSTRTFTVTGVGSTFSTFTTTRAGQ
jgi:hypothetical protein